MIYMALIPHLVTEITLSRITVALAAMLDPDYALAPKIVRLYDFRTTIITEHNLYLNDIMMTFSYLVDVNCRIYNKRRRP